MAQLKPPSSPTTRTRFVCISTIPKVKSWCSSEVVGTGRVSFWYPRPINCPEETAAKQAKNTCNESSSWDWVGPEVCISSSTSLGVSHPPPRCPGTQVETDSTPEVQWVGYHLQGLLGTRSIPLGEWVQDHPSWDAIPSCPSTWWGQAAPYEDRGSHLTQLSQELLGTGSTPPGQGSPPP